jgi:hypothetical protein
VQGVKAPPSTEHRQVGLGASVEKVNVGSLFEFLVMRWWLMWWW